MSLNLRLGLWRGSRQSELIKRVDWASQLSMSLFVQFVCGSRLLITVVATPHFGHNWLATTLFCWRIQPCLQHSEVKYEPWLGSGTASPLEHTWTYMSASLLMHVMVSTELEGSKCPSNACKLSLEVKECHDISLGGKDSVNCLPALRTSTPTN